MLPIDAGISLRADVAIAALIFSPIYALMTPHGRTRRPRVGRVAPPRAAGRNGLIRPDSRLSHAADAGAGA